MRKLIVGIAVLGLLGLYIPAQGGAIYRCDGYSASIVGTNDPDVIKGTSETDWITGRGGNDVISGLSGDDLICGGRGKDTLYAHSKAGFATCKGYAPEYLLGEQGNDRLFGGGEGYARLTGGGGDDLIDGCRARLLNPEGGPMADYNNAPGPVDVRLWKGVAKG